MNTSAPLDLPSMCSSRLTRKGDPPQSLTAVSRGLSLVILDAAQRRASINHHRTYRRSAILVPVWLSGDGWSAHRFLTQTLWAPVGLKGSDVLKDHPCLTDDRPSVHRSSVSVRSSHSDSNQTFLQSNLRQFSSVSYVWKEIRTVRKADYKVSIKIHFP